MTAPSKDMDNTKASEAAVALKEAGNKCYKEDDNEGALANYTKAIYASEELNDEKLLATCLKNRAAVYLKYEDWELVVSDCTRALELVPNDPKSLFRRCQAHEGNNALQILFPYLVDAVGSSGILKGKQKLGVTFNFDKQDVIDFTKFSKMTMCRASEANS